MRGLAGDVELRHETGFEFRSRQVERVLLGGQVLSGDLCLPLEAAKLDVVAGDLGHQGEQRVALVFDGGGGVGVGGFVGAAGAAEDVDLPRGVEAHFGDVGVGAGQTAFTERALRATRSGLR